MATFIGSMDVNSAVTLLCTSSSHTLYASIAPRVIVLQFVCTMKGKEKSGRATNSSELKTA